MKTAETTYTEYLQYMGRNKPEQTPMTFERFCYENDLQPDFKKPAEMTGVCDPMHY